MNGAWLDAAPAFLVAAGLFIVPGLLVRLAGWNPRHLDLYLFAPAVSVAVVAVAANIAPLVGLRWSLLPIAIVTAIGAAAAFALRRWVGQEATPAPDWRGIATLTGGLGLACVAIVAQLAFVFGSPENISQTFDNVVHLNSIKLALDSGDASALGIGHTSDIGFYPNAWQSFVALTASVTGVSVPVAVNATNLAIGGLVWPASCMAVAAVYFRSRPAALISSAALSTGFGAFPILLLYFGVLYPNLMGYALVPAGIASVLLVLRAITPATRVRAFVLLIVMCAGIGLGHPNAFLALFAIGTSITLYVLIEAALRARTRRTTITNGSVIVALLVVGTVLWQISRTAEAMSGWGPWQSTAQAIGEAVMLSPRAYPITVTASALIVIGLIAAIRRPSNLIIVIPFVVAGILFVLSSGTGVENIVRNMVTNPWYNDSYRLAALLPVAGIPVATLGAVTVVDVAAGIGRRIHTPRAVNIVVSVVAALALFSVAGGPNVVRTALAAQSAYASGPSSPLLTNDERQVLLRLEETTPGDARIAGNPWTGTSLAYALGDRAVVEKHIFGQLDDDEALVAQHLRDIDVDPRVCSAVERLGITHVLDFGSQNVFNNPSSGADHEGLNDLVPSEHLILIDSEGANARLFAIAGC